MLYLSFTWRWKCLFSTVLQPEVLHSGHGIPSLWIAVAASGEMWAPQHNVRWGWSNNSYVTGHMKSAGGSSASYFIFFLRGGKLKTRCGNTDVRERLCTMCDLKSIHFFSTGLKATGWLSLILDSETNYGKTHNFSKSSIEWLFE